MVKKVKVPEDMVPGSLFTSKQGYTLKILAYNKWDDVDFEFVETGNLGNSRASRVREGSVRNPNHKTNQGVGFIGVGPHKAHINSKATAEYNTWSDMIKRCYSVNSLEKRPSYIEAKVIDSWHNFQNFAEWSIAQYKEAGWALDKDILGNGSLYSPETCCYIPKEINSMFFSKPYQGTSTTPIGVECLPNNTYRVRITYEGTRINIGIFNSIEEARSAYIKGKKDIIKSIATKYQNILDDRIISSMLAWEVK